MLIFQELFNKKLIINKTINSFSIIRCSRFEQDIALIGAMYLSINIVDTFEYCSGLMKATVLRCCQIAELTMFNTINYSTIITDQRLYSD